MKLRMQALLATIALLAAGAATGPVPARAEPKPDAVSALPTTDQTSATPTATSSAPNDTDVAVPVEMPQPVKTVPPKYPRAAVERKQEGTVHVQARVLRTGKVGGVKVVKGKSLAPDLDKAATDAIRQWEFTPAKIDGKPVAAWVVIPVVFKLH